MDDLLQSQIRESCRLALPEGLRDLMSDISREVLRAQPPDLYEFIVSYLEALILARDTLCVACRVCRDLCTCACHPELDEELRNIGLDEEDLETAKNVIREYFDKGDVQEGNLLLKLFNKTDIDEDYLPDVQEAVRVAFQRHQRNLQAKSWAEAEEKNETGQRAAEHTMHYYDRVQEDRNNSWEEAAIQIQAAVQGNLVQENVKVPLDEAALKLKRKLSQLGSSTMMFEPVRASRDESQRASTSRQGRNNNRLSLSSTSLAGSLLNLPKHVPYSVHDMTYDEFEERETERKNIDYTLETHFRDSKKEDGSKKILFHEQHTLREIESSSIEEEEEGEIEELIEENIQYEEVAVNENTDDNKSVDEQIEVGFEEDKNKEKETVEDIAPMPSTSDKNITKESKQTSFDDHKFVDKTIDDDFVEEEIDEVDSDDRMELLKNVNKKVTSQVEMKHDTSSSSD